MKRVLITGAEGFVGRRCLDPLLARGYEVHAVDLSPGEPAAGEAVHRHSADLLKPGEIDKLISGIKPTHLLHFAWYTTPGKYWTSNLNYTWVKASLDLMASFREHGGERAVFAGSCAEYDWDFGFCSENITPATPATPYGVCKNVLRMMLEAFAKENKMSWAWGRMFLLYGPRENQARLVPSVITSLLQGKPALCTDGEQLRDFLYVQDAAGAFAALLDGNVQGPVNIASGVPVRVAQVVTRVENLLNQRDMVKFGALPQRENEPPVLIADTRRLRNEVGWAPEHDLESGIRLTIEWWKDLLAEGNIDD